MNNSLLFESRTGRLPVAPETEIHFRHYLPRDPVDDTAILCLPGFWRNSRDFERIASILAKRYVVVTPDMRGRGLSSRVENASDYRFEKLIDDTWQLLDHLRIKTTIVIGTTVGGFMGLQMAHDRPERVLGLILNDVGTETNSPGSKRYAGLVDHQDWSLDEVIAKTKTANGDYFPEFSDEDWQAYTLQAYRRVANDRYTRDFDELTNQETARFKRAKPSFWDEFIGLSIPIAIVRGEHSEYLPDELGRKMEAAHPQATLTTVDGRGHPPLLDEPQSIEAIEALIDAALH